MDNPYDIFGLPRNAPIEEVKRVYRLYVGKLHPDKHNGDPFFDDLLKNINKAYDAIINHTPYTSVQSHSCHSNTADMYDSVALRQENATLRKQIDDLQAQLRNQMIMQTEINMLRATVSVYEAQQSVYEAKLLDVKGECEATLLEAKREAENYQQLSDTYQKRSQRAITWCVAFAVGWALLFLINLI